MTFAPALGEGSAAWHLAQSTLAWAPVSLYLAVLWSNRVTSFHLETVWQRGMALGAIHFGMGAGQFVFGRVMVESRDIFPFGDRVAARHGTWRNPLWHGRRSICIWPCYGRIA